MVLRFILRHIASNEQLVNRLSESYAMRRAARFVVYVFNRGKLIAEEQELHKKLTPEEIRKFARRFSSNFREEITRARQGYQQKNK